MANLHALITLVVLFGSTFAWDFLGYDDIDAATPNPYQITSVVTNSYGVVVLAQNATALSTKNNEDPIESLTVNITYITSQTFRVKITDTNNPKRWQVPYAVQNGNAAAIIPLYKVVVGQVGSPLTIQITRNSDSKNLFYINSYTTFMYNDKDIFFTNSFNYAVKVMGLGERVSTFVLSPGTYTLWAQDRGGSPVDYGADGKENLYSSQPFYIAVDNNYTAHGGFFLNSNAMSAIVAKKSVAFRTTGGIIDYFGFLGPEPEDVLLQYHNVIGYPTLVPYWALGWHQSRWGYQNLTYLQGIVNSYITNNIPLDVIWTDIDYMNKFYDFTFDPVNYPQVTFTKWVQSLQLMGKHWVPIVDCGIPNDNTYSVYTSGLASNVFIQSAYVANTPTVGQVWPGNSVYPDWFNPATSNWWLNQLKSFQSTIPFSGLWLDMNEASNFITGEVGHTPPSIINNLTMPYTPGDDINTKTIDVASTHYSGILEYDAHNLFGSMEAAITNSYFTNTLKTRAFILTRSSFPGSGRVASKWTGDNYSSWGYLQYSITGIFDFGLYGISHGGADICGFFGNTNEELCSRWMQLGTLYPFSRNHNSYNSIPQEPWAFGETLLQTSSLSIRNRYSIFLYISTGMFLTSLNGGAFFRPTFFDYPSDFNLLNNATAHFMLGDSILVHPCIWPGVTGTDSYFPYDIYYDFFSGIFVQTNYDNNMYIDMPLPGVIPMHIRGGRIVPTLDSASSVQNLQSLRSSNITMIVALNGNLQAFGTIVFDDGLSANTISSTLYTQVQYNYNYYNETADVFVVNPLTTGYTRPTGEFPSISNIVIYGCAVGPQKIYKLAGGVLTPLNAYFLWDPYNGICRIYLGLYILPPDQPYQLIINYFN